MTVGQLGKYRLESLLGIGGMGKSIRRTTLSVIGTSR